MLVSLLASFVVAAQPAQIPHAPVKTLSGGCGGLFGFGVAGGHLDGDGVVDLLVFEFGAVSNCLHGYSGSDGSKLLQLSRFSHGLFPPLFENLGDTNGDGWSDLVVRHDSDDLVLRSGRNGKVLAFFPLESFEVDAANIGDVDLDGVDELAVSDPGAPSGASSSGVVTVYSGRRKKPLFTIENPFPLGAFGGSVAGVGDVDGDSIPDIAVGSPFDGHPLPPTPPFIPFPTPDGAGSVAVLSGADGSIIWYALSDSPHQGMGARIAAAGDVDADGVGDVIAASAGDGGADHIARVYSGVDGSQLHTFGPFVPGSVTLVAGAGDVNGDGHADVFVTNARFPGFPGASENSVFLFSGADGSLLHDLPEPATFPGLVVMSADGIGDLDGDGLDDFIVGFGVPIVGQGYAQVFASGAP